MNAVDVSGLIKTYPAKPPVEAVRGIDLVVPVGECFGLLGPNGAGKTTTMEILEGILDPTAGTVRILGQEWGTHADEIRSRIGISLQETQLTDKLTVRETVGLFCSFYARGLTPEEAIGRVSLNDKAGSFVGKLSGGQKQRLAVACAIVGDPELLFLDEPTTGLDPQSRRQLWEIIRDYRRTGRTVIVTTHYMDEAERLCDRVAVVDRGQVIALGSPRELISRLGGEHVIDFGVEPDGSAVDEDRIRAIPSVTTVRAEQGVHQLTVGEPHLVIPKLMDYLRSAGVGLTTLSTRHATLEDVFVNLTGRHLRDDAA